MCTTFQSISISSTYLFISIVWALPIYLYCMCTIYLSLLCVLPIYLYCMCTTYISLLYVYYLSISIVCVLPIYLNCMCTYILYGSIFSLGPTLCSLCIGITSYLIGVHNATPTFGISNFGINR